MPIIGGEVLIFRPRGAVFDFVADERHEPAFNPRMANVELVSGEPLGTGSRMSATASSFAARNRHDDRVHDIRAPESAGLPDDDGLDDHRRRAYVRRGPWRHTSAWSWDVRPTGFMRLLGPIVTRIGKRQEAQCWEGLKRDLETEEHP